METIDQYYLAERLGWYVEGYLVGPTKSNTPKFLSNWDWAIHAYAYADKMYEFSLPVDEEDELNNLHSKMTGSLLLCNIKDVVKYAYNIIKYTDGDKKIRNS